MKPDLEIRDAQAGDRDAILSINRDGRPGVTPLAPDEIDACLASATLFRVAELRDAVVAYVIALAAGFREIGDEYAWFSRRFREFLYVDQIAVAPAAQRLGVAAALYADLERAARERGLPLLVCEVNLRPANPRSLRFHRREGFGEVGTLEVSDGRFVALLAKEL